ncbi:hypothetical protein [Sinomonas atrocyanea]
MSTVSSSNRQATSPRESSWWDSVRRVSIPPRTLARSREVLANEGVSGLRSRSSALATSSSASSSGSFSGYSSIPSNASGPDS